MKKIISLSVLLFMFLFVGLSHAAPYSRGHSEKRFPERNEERRYDRNSERHEERRDNHWANRRPEQPQSHYQSSQWETSRHGHEYRMPWTWRSRGHYDRRPFHDPIWDREFPGLRSYHWHGPGFWYQGCEYRDLVMFYDPGDFLVAIGFWQRGRFVMIRYDGCVYFTRSQFVVQYWDKNVNIRIRF